MLNSYEQFAQYKIDPCFLHTVHQLRITHYFYSINMINFNDSFPKVCPQHGNMCIYRCILFCVVSVSRVYGMYVVYNSIYVYIYHRCIYIYIYKSFVVKRNRQLCLYDIIYFSVPRIIITLFRCTVRIENDVSWKPLNNFGRRLTAQR